MRKRHGRHDGSQGKVAGLIVTLPLGLATGNRTDACEIEHMLAFSRGRCYTNCIPSGRRFPWEATVTLSEFYDEVARRADTDKTKINAAETKRVLSEAFIVLSGLDAASFADIVSKGVARAKAKSAKAKTK